MTDTLSRYQAIVPGLQQDNGPIWRASCPVHKGEAESFSVNVESGLWWCGSCTYSSLEKLESMLSEPTPVSAPSRTGRKTPVPLTSTEIAAYYRERVPGLQQAGHRWEGRCPVHGGDNRDSFKVNPETGQWFCHSECSRGGNVVQLEAELHHAGDTKAAWAKVCELVGREMARIIATYDYNDAEGKLLYQSVRYEPKDFSRRRPDPESEGKWIWSVQRTIMVPYRLPQVLAADTVYIVEGEKDVATLEQLGIVGTCNVGGAKSWLTTYNRHFKGKHVVILPDQDEAGQLHGNSVAYNLLPVAASVKLVNLPAGPKGDVTDWVTAGGTREALDALVEASGTWEPGQGMELLPGAVAGGWEAFKPLMVRQTDLANGEVFAGMNGDVARWVPEFGNWIVWNETEGRWAVDNSLAIYQLAYFHLRNMRQAAKELNDTQLTKHAEDSESKHGTDSMIACAKSFLVIHADTLDSDPYLLNVANGTLDLKTGELREHRKEDFITRLVPVVYNPDARSAEFEKFLDTIMCGNRELVAFLQLFAGYSLCGWTGERKLVCLHGQTGSNGKSTLVDVLQMIAGEYYMTASFASFQKAAFAQSGSQATPDLARLSGARIVTAAEPAKGTNLDTGLIKNATGEDKITARHLNKAPFSFVPQFKLWLIFNDAPRIEGSDDAMWTRVLRVPFDHKFTNPDLSVKGRMADPVLTGPAALAWAVRGSVEYHRSGLKIPQVIREGTQQYRDEQDPLVDFYQACCVFREGATWETGALHSAYRGWAEDEHFPEWKILTRRKLIEHLKKFRKCETFRTKQNRNDVYAVRGIAAKSFLEEPGDLFAKDEAA